MSEVYSACRMIGCHRNELNQHTQLFNKDELEYYVWIELPFHITEPVRLYSVYEQRTSSSPENLRDLYDGAIDTDTGKPLIIHETNKWVKIAKKVLNLLPGQHTYKLTFMRADINDIEIPIYFSYILQDDCPDKPYIYMKKGDNCNETDLCK